MTDKKALSKSRFSQFAEGYVTSKTHSKGSDLEKLVEIADPQPEWKVLDIATGGGHTARTFAAHVQEVVASDISPDMLAAARASMEKQGVKNVTFKEADAENLPFEDNTFDLVTCRIAPHHFPNVQKFVSEAARVVKPGHVFLMQDQLVPDADHDARYIDQFETLRDPSHDRVYNRSEWQIMFENAGLTVFNLEAIAKRKSFHEWVQTQDCSEEVVNELVRMIHDAPEGVAEWFEPLNFDQPDASFQHRYIIIAGRKG
ncbi:MAG: methyltransferase domain-containing protein [Anaerolineaceae bacterium]|nr:methyltransferase domain-containing protein [Anaerolineaceae bacterium]